MRRVVARHGCCVKIREEQRDDKSVKNCGTTKAGQQKREELRDNKSVKNSVKRIVKNGVKNSVRLRETA